MKAPERRRRSPSLERDRDLMRLALAEARRGLGKTRPNPAVGAVIARDGRVIAKGHHERAGGPHAEIVALSRAGTRARGATLYVTLEPCSHVGRTGPCVEAVIAAGVRRVVLGCRDQNPLVDGRGIGRLRRAGVAVTLGVLEDDCRALNRAFFCWIRHRRPLVTLKAASSADGIIGDEGAARRRKVARVRWLTSTQARAHAHELRAAHDAILVGVGTVLADDPRLTVRGRGRGERAEAGLLRVVLDSQLRTPPAAALLREPGRAPLIIGVEAKRPTPTFTRRLRALRAAGAEVALLSADHTGRPPLREVLALLAGRDVQSLLVEGGSHVHGAFIASGLVDRVALFLAPRLVGGGVPVACGPGLGVEHGLALGPFTVTPLGPDLLLQAEVVPAHV